MDKEISSLNRKIEQASKRAEELRTDIVHEERFALAELFELQYRESRHGKFARWKGIHNKQTGGLVGSNSNGRHKECHRQDIPGHTFNRSNSSHRSSSNRLRIKPSSLITPFRT